MVMRLDRGNPLKLVHDTRQFDDTHKEGLPSNKCQA